MTKEQYNKLQSKIGNKLCPICGKQLATFIYDNTNVFCSNSMVTENYKEINIPDVEYFKMECERCGFVITFNMKKLLR